MGFSRGRRDPGGEARQPAVDVGAIEVVLRAEGAAEGGLLVEANKGVGDEPGAGGVDEERCAAEEECLAGEESEQRHVHGIADESIRARDDKGVGRKKGRGSAVSLKGEASEGVENHDEAERYEGDTDGAERSGIPWGGMWLPASDEPGDESDDRAGAEDQEEGGDERGGGAFHGALLRRDFAPEGLLRGE